MTATNQRFTDARLKRDRAQSHVHRLIDEYTALLNSDFARLVIENDFEPGSQRAKIVSMADFPPTIPLIIGDAVHNLRVAFDYIMVAVTQIDTMALPVGKKWNDVKASKHYGAIKESMPELASFILDTIQPYRRGQFKLWELSELDRIDKHRLLLPTISEAHRIGVDLEDQSGERISNAYFTHTDKFATTRTFRGPVTVHNEGQSALSIRFGPGTPLENVPVLESLDNFCELALEAIKAFEDFHFGK